ncbi:MAG: exosome complex protein Rrp4 [Desulfurococcaceae archaeon]|nr:exosome complex protein Rrp4 [Desulfurococcaceae archaeon]
MSTTTPTLKILVADRQIVRPGDCLALIEGVFEQKLKHIPEKHIYILGNRVYSDVVGVVSIENNTLSVVPLESTYIPRKDDTVIGVISGVSVSSWSVDIKSPYKAILPASDVIEGFNPAIHNLRNYLDIGDYVLAKVAAFDRLRDPVLTVKGKGLGKIIDGYVVEIKPSKVARVIGKKGSMYNLLTNMTKCELVVGVNGYIWARCPDERVLDVLVKAIRLIETKAHMRGLTEEVRSYLASKLGVQL